MHWFFFCFICTTRDNWKNMSAGWMVYGRGDGKHVISCDTLWQQHFLMGTLKRRRSWPHGKHKSTSLHLLHWGNSLIQTCVAVQVGWHSHAQLTSPECVKVTSTSAAVHPTPPPQSLLTTAQFRVAVFMCLTCVVVCFLLWAEFYTVCQSPERHTLEGPVEWDTKSDPPGEQLFSHLPPSSLFCLSLSSSLFFFFFSLHTPLSFLILSLFLPTPSITPQTPGQVWASQIPSVLERLRYICWRAQCSSGRPSPADIPPACITASVQLMNTTEGMCQCPFPLPLRLISFSLSMGATVYNDSVRNKERKHPSRMTVKCLWKPLERNRKSHAKTPFWLLKGGKVSESHEDPERAACRRSMWNFKTVRASWPCKGHSRQLRSQVEKQLEIWLSLLLQVTLFEGYVCLWVWRFGICGSEC